MLVIVCQCSLFMLLVLSVSPPTDDFILTCDYYHSKHSQDFVCFLSLVLQAASTELYVSDEQGKFC